MANKKLKVGGSSDLRLPTKTVKGEKKTKWQAKTGGKNKGKEPAVEPHELTAQEEHILPPEPTDAATVATSPDTRIEEPTLTNEAAPAHDESTAAEPAKEAIPEEPVTKKPRKLKVKADIKPKKLSMMAAALQVLHERKAAMTCPELIDVMATEGLWSSPGGKTPANTLYAAISRDIKDKGKASAFRKAERGRFEGR
ncbi:MAG: winged helix-turn-helix domain-containing protein [Planctomycetia bacterium]|nr:winged helix-turn-helix domain-containing protein [Planctomycetia bacterium]